MANPVTPHISPDFESFARSLRAEAAYREQMGPAEVYTLKAINDRGSLLTLAEHVEAVGRRMSYIKGA